jgi:hypothetical protein
VAYSWRTKVERAEHHLGDFKDRIASFSERRAYPVSEGIETEDQQRVHVSRIDIPEPTDPLLPVIAGEIMFSLRSALDHLATALVPEDERTRSTAFPLFAQDINELDALTGKHLHRKARKRWLSITKGFPQEAMPMVEYVQAYHLKGQGLDPQYASLSLLRTFQNADKHSRLVFVVSGLRDPTSWVTTNEIRKRRVPLPRVPPDRVLPPRTAVRIASHPLPANVKMEIEGAVEVMIGDGESGAYFRCPFIFEAMIRDTTGVLDRLEEFAVHLPRPPKPRIA